MSRQVFDFRSAVEFQDNLPRPNWDAITSWHQHQPPAAGSSKTFWTEIATQWLELINQGFSKQYQLFESKNFLALILDRADDGERLLRFAENSRQQMQQVLGFAAFDDDYKEVVLLLKDDADYQRYLVANTWEIVGESAGMHVREGYTHIVLNGQKSYAVERNLAHELTHVALQHLQMPQWIEEGLAQIFENDLTHRNEFFLTRAAVESQQDFWRVCGLDDFWSGAGFYAAGELQPMCYQLAEILVRILVQNAQPAWLGWDRRPQQKFTAFIQAARYEDSGAQACQEHLGYSIGELAAKYLGPGEWEPRFES